MPNIKSAAKRVELTRLRTLRNARIKSALKTTIRKFEESLKTADREDATLKLRSAVRVLDKAVTKGILHKNAASRKKSRLTRRFNKTTV